MKYLSLIRRWVSAFSLLVHCTYYRMYVIEDYASCKYILVVQNQYSDSSCKEFESEVTDSGTDAYGMCGSSINGGYSMIQYYGGIDAPTFPVDVILNSVTYASLNDCNSNSNIVFGYATAVNVCWNNMKYTCDEKTYTRYVYQMNTNCNSNDQPSAYTANLTTTCTSASYFPDTIYEKSNFATCLPSSSSPNQQPTSYPTAMQVKETATNMIYVNYYASSDCKGDFYNSISLVPVGICMSESPKEAANNPNTALSTLFSTLTIDDSTGTWSQSEYSYCDADCKIPNYYMPSAEFTNEENGILMNHCYPLSNSTVGSVKYYYKSYHDAIANSQKPGTLGMYQYQEFGGSISRYYAYQGCEPFYSSDYDDDDYVYISSGSYSCELGQNNYYTVTMTYYPRSQSCNGVSFSNSSQIWAGEINGDDEYSGNNLYNISQFYCNLNNDAKAASLSPAEIAGVAVGVSLGALLIGGIVFYYFYYKGYLISKGLLKASNTTHNTTNEDIEIRDSKVVNPIQL